MALLKKWRDMAYSETANKGDLQRLWSQYFEEEKGIYAQLLKNPDEVVTGTVKELAENVIGSGGEKWITELSNDELMSMMRLG